MEGIADGVYEVIVVDCQEVDDRSSRFDLAFTTGPHKGEVVHVRGVVRIDRALGLLGTPVRLVVEDGVPRVLPG